MSRGAVLFRTYFWDEFAARSAARLRDQSEGLDFFVQINESQGVAADVAPFRKLAHANEDFERLGLPVIAHGRWPVLWWNCDYTLYDAALRLPDYEYYVSIEYDVAVNTPVLPLVERVLAGGQECMTPFELMDIHDAWAYRASCADMPFAVQAWTQLPIMMVSRRAARHLLAERQRLGRMYAAGQLAGWPISEAFFASAVLEAGFGHASLRRICDLRHFTTEAIYLETDEAARRPGSFAHSVLDAGRFWDKFISRAYGVWLARGDYAALQHARASLIAAGRTEHAGWRLGTAPGNLALDRPARQSSLSPASRASRSPALDAITADARGGNSGVLTGGFGFHTGAEQAPWWEVDLGAVGPVASLRLYAGVAHGEQARRLHIEVSADRQHWDEAFRKADDRVFAGIDDPLVCRLPQPVPAQFIRIVGDVPGALLLDEVEVYGAEAGHTDKSRS